MRDEIQTTVKLTNGSGWTVAARLVDGEPQAYQYLARAQAEKRAAKVRADGWLTDIRRSGNRLCYYVVLLPF